MNRIRIAAASVNQTPLDWTGNRERLVTAIESARKAGAQLVCLPELAITGYGCEDMFFAVGVQQTALDELAALAQHGRGLVVAVGLPVYCRNSLANAIAVIVDGEVTGFACKQYLASDGIHYEPRWFRPWPAGEVDVARFAGQELPAGDVTFAVGGVRMGFEICRDAWVADRVGQRLVKCDVDILLNPSASHFAFGKQLVRERYMLDGSRRYASGYVYCNLLGNESGRSVYDGGTAIATCGRMVAQGPMFAWSDGSLVVADLDLDEIRRTRVQSLAVSPMPESAYEAVSPFAWRSHEPSDAPATQLLPLRTEPQLADYEDFSQAVPLALWDYLRKSHARGFVLSLSGGADSAAVAVLVSLAIRRAVRALGGSGFCERLSWMAPLRDIVGRHAEATPDELAQYLTQALLTVAYQSTRNSTDVTHDAAHTVAQTVGARWLDWSVDSLVEDYVATVSRALGRELSWTADDLALQNIQARARGPAIWLVANIEGKLLLATSNRSEAAVGYATMDGDTCGGLSPVAGIDKHFLRGWLRWMESTGPADLGPLPQLAAVNRQQPTAELRPPGEHQTDEGDLMPYDVLDAVERSAIRDKQLPREVLATLTAEFPQYGRAMLGGWVVRFFTLWCRNQWKRERYAPSFHVDDENLDPKSWCRFPILSSGFARELAELKAELER